MGPCFSQQAKPKVTQSSGMQLTQPKSYRRKTPNLKQGQSTKMQDYNSHQKEIEQQKKELKKRQAELNQKANQLKELKDSMQKKIRNLEQQQIRIEEKSKQPETSVSVQKMIKQEDLFPIQGRELQGLLHRSIGAITFLNKYKQRHMGSGVLISKNVVLTAAHNVFSRIQGEEYEDFKVYFGADGVAKDYYEVQAIRYPEQYKTCKNNQVVSCDYALLRLSKQVSYNQFPTVSLGCPTCLIQKNKKTILQIFGFPGQHKQNYYPLDKFHNQIKLTQYGMALKNTIIEIHPQQHKICYGISTMPGQSGCPVMIDEQIIAMHLGGGKADQQFNIGRLIDISMVKRLQDWCKQLHCHPFSIKDNFCVHLQPILTEYLKEKQERKKKQTTKKLELQDKQLKQINVSEYTNLTELSLSNNQLYAIDVTKNTNLTELRLFNNQLSAIDVTKNTNLTFLWLNNNQLSAIDVAKNTNLTYLSLSNNKLSAIDVTKNTNLTELYLYNNQLSAIDVTKNTNLADLRVSDNQLSAINVTKNTNLTVLSLFNNQLSAINVTKNTNLTKLYLYNNQLSAIDVTKNTNLTVLSLFNNQLSAIDVTKNTNLTVLSLFNNQLSAIDVTKNTNLTYLRLHNNQLSAIDVTKNTNLTYLSLYNNQLSAIDVTKNTKLNQLCLQNNRLETVSLSFVASKPIEKYLGSDYFGDLYFNFSNQLSAVCVILIRYNSADKCKCSEVKEGWAKNNGNNGKNEHECKYAFLAIEE